MQVLYIHHWNMGADLDLKHIVVSLQVCTQNKVHFLLSVTHMWCLLFQVLIGPKCPTDSCLQRQVTTFSCTVKRVQRQLWPASQSPHKEQRSSVCLGLKTAALISMAYSLTFTKKKHRQSPNWHLIPLFIKCLYKQMLSTSMLSSVDAV